MVWPDVPRLSGDRLRCGVPLKPSEACLTYRRYPSLPVFCHNSCHQFHITLFQSSLDMFRYPIRIGTRPGAALKAKSTSQSAGRLLYPRHVQTIAASPATRNAFYSNPSFYYGLAIGAAAFGWGVHQILSPSAAPLEIQYANSATMLQVCSQCSDCHSGGKDIYLILLSVLKAAKEIKVILGSAAVSFDEDVIEAHGHSDWSTSNSTGRPVAIVYPNNTKDVSEIAKICYKHSVPMGESPMSHNLLRSLTV